MGREKIEGEARAKPGYMSVIKAACVYFNKSWPVV